MTKAWLLPDVIDPPETVCVQIEVPKDDTHIQAFFGALQQLGLWWNWERDDLKSGLAVSLVWQRQLALAAENVRTGVNCMLDCDDVEDCLETSPIITTIETNIVINETDITQNETNITNNETNITNIVINPADGSTYPDAPDSDTDPDPACGAAYYNVVRLREWIAEVEGLPVSYPTIFDAMEALFAGELLLSFSIVIALLENVYTIPAPPSILADFDAQLDEMREWLYCEGFDKPAFDNYVRTTLTNGVAIADYIAGVAFVTWQQWYVTGSTDLTQDCSAYVCGTWCKVWNVSEGFADWTIIDGIVDAIGLRSELVIDGGAETNRFKMTLPKIPSATRILLSYEWDGYKTQNTFPHERLILPDTTQYGHTHPPLSESGIPGDISRDIFYDGTLGAGIITVLGASGTDVTPPLDTGGYNVWIVSVQIEGDGANPFGADNC